MEQDGRFRFADEELCVPLLLKPTTSISKDISADCTAAVCISTAIVLEPVEKNAGLKLNVKFSAAPTAMFEEASVA